MRQLFNRFIRDTRGVSALEYAILAGLIVGAVAVGANALNGNLTTLFSNLNIKMSNAADKAGT
jgi:pilus assembly protein Flp/PilA